MSDWIVSVIRAAGYPGIALLMLLENVVPPVPSELIMPLAGYLVSRDQFSLWGVVIAGTLGSVAGAVPLYYGARKLGQRRVERFASEHGRWLTVCPEDIQRATDWFRRHRAFAVAFGRLIPGVRSLVAIPAGVARLHVASFLLLTALGAAVWNIALAGGGYLLATRFRLIEEYLGPITNVVVGLMVVVYVIRVIRFRG